MRKSVGQRSRKRTDFLRGVLSWGEQPHATRADPRHRRLACELLEQRTLLDGTFEPAHILFDSATGAPWVRPQGQDIVPADIALPAGMTPLGASAYVGLTPDQIRTAYGITGDGAGTTIALVDAFDDPNIVGDLHQFDQQFGLSDPVFSKVQVGFSGTNTNSEWITEMALDVEWSHAIAPAASILLVEAKDNSTDNLMAAVDYARRASGVVAVSMSWGSGEYSGETDYDGYLTTPTGHTGVTFLASTGDTGSPGGYPGYSPNVVAVGGTTLTLSGNNYVSETAWSGSGGGQSTYESQPSYQYGVQGSGRRQIPDVAFDADPVSGVAVYDSYNGGSDAPWYKVGGTSVSSPCWAGLVAIADGLRISQSSTPLDGRWQTLSALYWLSAADFHDITSGSNGGFPAYPGYDNVTGLGTPRASLLAADLAATTMPRGVFYSANMDTDPGWTTSGQWAFGQPTGQGGATYLYPDPTSGCTGSNVYGVNLNGDYSTTAGGPYYLTSAPIDCSQYMDVKLQFARWLNSDFPTYDLDTVDVSNDGVKWINVYTSTSGMSEGSWHLVQYDLSAVANNQASVRVRWGYQIQPGATRLHSGWNIDDVALLGTPGTVPPRPTSLTPSLTLVTTNNVGPAAFSLTVVYDRAMNQSVIPSLTFPAEDPGPTLLLNAAQSGWSNGTTYVAKYDVANTDTGLYNVVVRVSGAKDTAGTLESPNTFPAEFSIDTLNAPPLRNVIDLIGDTGDVAGTSHRDLRPAAISADGRYVAFSSIATDLVPGDTNYSRDVFVKDMQTGTVTMASTDSSGTQSYWQDSLDATISADGRYVEFTSNADNFVDNDTNNSPDIFVKDLRTGMTTRVSTDSSGNQFPDGSKTGTISADGRYVAFECWTTNLPGGNTNHEFDIFLKDLLTGKTTRVSTDSAGSEANADSNFPEISADDRYVTFSSTASNLVSGDTNGCEDVFVKDLQTGITTRVSTDSSGSQGNYASFGQVINADGSYVAFMSAATNLVSGDTNGHTDVFVKNLKTGITTRVSTDSSGNQGNNQSCYPGISADGRYVSFYADASNLVAGDTNAHADVFVKDLQTGTTTRLSTDTIGNQGNANSLFSAMSADGAHVAFQSYAGNLVAGTTNGTGYIVRAAYPLSPWAAVTSVTPSVTTVADPSVGTATFSVTVVYNQAMKTTVPPTLAFTPDVTTGPSATLTLNTGASGWTTSTTYVAKYNVAESETIVPNIGIGVTGAQDLYGNVQTPAPPLAASFNVDTLDPVAPTIVGLANDTGASPTDKITSDPSLMLDNIEAGATVLYSFSYDGGSTWSSWGPNTPVDTSNGTLISVEVRQSDVEGNVSPTSAAFTFTLDTTGPPALTIAGLVNDTGAGPADLLTLDPTLSLSPGEPNAAVQYSFDGGATWGANTPPQGAVSVEVRQQDVAGNAGPASAPFSYTFDSAAPVVSSAVPSETMIEASNQGTNLVVRVFFSETMWYGYVPVVSFSPDVIASGELTPVPSGTFWVNTTQYNAAFSVANAGVYVPAVGISVAGVKDLAGNPAAPASFPNAFDIDTLTVPAHVANVAPSVSEVSQSNLGKPDLNAPVGQGFVVRVTYDTDMAYNAGYTPVVTIASPDASPTLTPDPADSWWVNPTTYRAGFDVSGTSTQNVQGFHIAVAGGHDLANSNVQARYVSGEAFNINMTHALPRAYVVNCYSYLTLVSNRNVGSDTFGVTVSYNRGMSMGANLAFSFLQGGVPVDVSSVLQQDTLGSYWINSTDYKVQYNVLSGSSVDYSNLSIHVTGGQDPVGNPPTPYTSPALFGIDMVDVPPPLARVKSITEPLEMVTAANTMANAGPDSFGVTVTYDQPMGWWMSIPTITFVPDPGGWPVAGLLRFDPAASWWTAPDTYVARFTVQNYYNIVNRSVGITVSGGKDAYGNPQPPFSVADCFEVNTAATSPLASVTSVVPSTTVVTKATVGAPVAGQWMTGFVERITYDQPMAGYSPVVTLTAVDPTQQQALNNTLTWDSGWSWWFDATTFRAAFDVADSGVNLQGITIHVKWARSNTFPYYDEARYSGPVSFSIDTLTPVSLSPSAASPSAASLTDAVLSSGVLNLSVGFMYDRQECLSSFHDRQECLSSATSTDNQQTAVNPIDQALALAGTWLDVRG